MPDHADPTDPLRALTDLLGTPPVDASEQEAVLDLTRVVAHSVERRLAPLTAYALGLALAATTDPAERAARVRNAIMAVEGRPGAT